LFEMYDMYQKTENVSKVQTIDQAVPNVQTEYGRKLEQSFKSKCVSPTPVDLRKIVKPVSGPHVPSKLIEHHVDKGKTPEVDQIKQDEILARKLQESLSEPVVQNKKRKRRRNRGRGKKAKEAKPVSVVKETFAEKASKPPKKEAVPREPKSLSLKKFNPERKCFCCGGVNHTINKCWEYQRLLRNPPQGYVRMSKEEWEQLSDAERLTLVHKNRSLLIQNAKQVKPQSVSIHNPVKGDLAFHDNLIQLFLPGCNNAGVNSEYWGTMLKAEMDGKKYVFITEHQLKMVVIINRQTKRYMSYLLKMSGSFMEKAPCLSIVFCLTNYKVYQKVLV